MREHIKMKKKFLVVGDNHLDSKNPKSRVDNYLESSLMELKETLQIAKAAKVDYYILLGDVFDRIEVGGICRNKVLEILLDDDGLPWPFQKYVVMGNHDLNHNPQYLEKSALETLIKSKAVKCGFGPVDNLFAIYNFSPTLDEQLRNGLLKNESSKILFLHASITDKPSRFEHVLFDDLELHKDTKLVCSGHIHSPMESKNQNGVKFFNPGCVGRTEIGENHSPQVLFIQYDTDTDEIVHKYFKLKNSMPHDLIFDIEGAKNKKFNDKNAEMFINSVTSTSFSDKMSHDVEKDFIIFAENRKINKNVINTVINAINLIKTGTEA
jgi:DNA repair exonuclease SbcCD nuclease subunit